MLVLDHVTVAHGRRTVLRDLSLQVPDGGSTAVTGPSGAGKTTLLWAIAGLVPLASGTIVLDGRTVLPGTSRARREYRRRHVGMVLQGGELVPELTALENIALGGLLAGMNRSQVLPRARTIMATLGLEPELANQVAATLSGGERQRVAVARAIVHEPRLVLADEPTAALDAENAQITTDLLASLPQAYGCMLVVVSHDERVAARMDTSHNVVPVRGTT